MNIVFINFCIKNWYNDIVNWILIYWAIHHFNIRILQFQFSYTIKQSLQALSTHSTCLNYIFTYQCSASKNQTIIYNELIFIQLLMTISVWETYKYSKSENTSQKSIHKSQNKVVSWWAKVNEFVTQKQCFVTLSC